MAPATSAPKGHRHCRRLSRRSRQWRHQRDLKTHCEAAGGLPLLCCYCNIHPQRVMAESKERRTRNRGAVGAETPLEGSNVFSAPAIDLIETRAVTLSSTPSREPAAAAFGRRLPCGAGLRALPHLASESTNGDGGAKFKKDFQITAFNATPQEDIVTMLAPCTPCGSRLSC